MLDLTKYFPLPIAILISIGFMIATAIFMESVAWFLHRFVMHQFGWYLHEDHHRYTKHRFQKNDIFGLIFAILSILLILFGLLYYNLLLWIGVGVAIYGFGYFAFHDVMFHKRIKNTYRPKKGYMKRIFNAHSYHHQTTNAKGKGKAFGFLYAPKKYNDLTKLL